jgi:hypothetical protein
MRPFLPQSKFNFPVLLKLIAIYGVITLIVLLCLVVLVFVVPRIGYYIDEFQWGGMSGLVGELSEDFVGKDSDFIWMISRSPLLTVLAPFGVGGILGVFHYIIVRKRRSNIPH